MIRLRTFRSLTASKEDLFTELSIETKTGEWSNDFFDFSWIGEIEDCEGLHFNVQAKCEDGNCEIDKIKCFEEIEVRDPKRIFG